MINLGHAGVDPSAGGGAGFAGAGGFGDIFDTVFGDIFGNGGPRGSSRAYRGADLRYDLEMSLEDAVRGNEVKIRVPTLVDCEPCGGSGSRTKAAPDRLCYVQWSGTGSNADRGFSPCSKPARNAAGKAKSSRIPAHRAKGRVRPVVTKRLL